MKFPKSIIKYILISILFIAIAYDSISSYKTESFVEGACTSVTQTELQNRVLNELRQPVLNDKNVVVTSTSVIDSINKVVSDGTYTDCEQIADLQKIIDSNISSKDSTLSALNSYYTTKTKSK